VERRRFCKYNNPILFDFCQYCKKAAYCNYYNYVEHRKLIAEDKITFILCNGCAKLNSDIFIKILYPCEMCPKNAKNIANYPNTSCQKHKLCITHAKEQNIYIPKKQPRRIYKFKNKK